MTYDELKESILFVLDRRLDELGEELQRMKESGEKPKDYMGGYKDGYLALLNDLEDLIRNDQLD